MKEIIGRILVVIGGILLLVGFWGMGSTIYRALLPHDLEIGIGSRWTAKVSDDDDPWRPQDSFFAKVLATSNGWVRFQLHASEDWVVGNPETLKIWRFRELYAQTLPSGSNVFTMKITNGVMDIK